MARRHWRWAAMSGMAGILCACGAAPGSSQLGVGSTQPFPVVNWTSSFHPQGATLSHGYSLTGLPVNAQLDFVTANRLVVSEFPDAANGWRQTVYAVNPKIGVKEELLRLPVQEEAPAVAVNGSWMVYEEALASNGSYRTMTALNLTSHRSRTILTLPQGTYSAGEVSGLTIRGAVAYWLANLMTPKGLVSRIYSYNLARHRLTTLASMGDTNQHLLFLSMTPSPQGLWISVARSQSKSGQLGGALWLLSLRTHNITRRIPLWHAPTLLYGANGSQVLLSCEVQAGSATPSNSGPYPLYTLNVDTRQLVQLTSAVNPGGVATLDGDWVTINGVGTKSLLINLRTKTESSYGEPQAFAGGGWLVLRGPGSLYWQALPKR